MPRGISRESEYPNIGTCSFVAKLAADDVRASKATHSVIFMFQLLANQNRVVSPTRTAVGDPGVMLLSL